MARGQLWKAADLMHDATRRAMHESILRFDTDRTARSKLVAVTDERDAVTLDDGTASKRKTALL